MKISFMFERCIAVGVLIMLWASAVLANISVVLYDNFDDGTYNGWSVTYSPHPAYPTYSTYPPDIVSSPQGYALRGISSGYHSNPASTFISTPFNVSNVGPLTLEMRAKSGPDWPNSIELVLFSGQDFYRVRDHGEANKQAVFGTYVNSIEYNYLHSIGDRAYEWHDFALSRDSAGWWSLKIDGTAEVADFYQDTQLTSFDFIGIQLLRNQSEIEWVRVSAEVVPVPGALLLGTVGLGVSSLLCRRHRRS